MPEPCPCCHGTGVTPDSVDELRRYALAHGFAVDPFDRVDERCAAALLGVVPGTLRNDRSTYRVIPFEHAGRAVRYSLRALARHLRR